ncbi:zinc finger, C2H2 type [Ancylostoma caninum]|uniref:Zinc finger, C2H2 type n=1 Tax=Ancylostoma caninum TaxID=29170 RepID=A0A368GI53_ANCCA|nr:zinc finger, C2H2 type [Ancylostoma caninum]
MNNSSAQCHICKNGPFLLSNLYAHLRRFHYCSEYEVNEVRRAIKRAKYRVLQEVKCELCGKAYFSDGGLRKHKRLAHKEAPITQSEPSEDHQVRAVSVACPACGKSLPSSIELAVHLPGEPSRCGRQGKNVKLSRNWSGGHLGRAARERRICTCANILVVPAERPTLSKKRNGTGNASATPSIVHVLQGYF